MGFIIQGPVVVLSFFILATSNVFELYFVWGTVFDSGLLRNKHFLNMKISFFFFGHLLIQFYHNRNTLTFIVSILVLSFLREGLVTQAGLEFSILLPEPLEYWDLRFVLCTI